jgi:predicted nucleic acid-binding protein
MVRDPGRHLGLGRVRPRHRRGVDQRLTGLIASGDSLAVTEPVVMVMLAGARSDQRESDLRRLLLRFRLLQFDTVAGLDAAARIYRAAAMLE